MTTKSTWTLNLSMREQTERNTGRGDGGERGIISELLWVMLQPR